MRVSATTCKNLGNRGRVFAVQLVLQADVQHVKEYMRACLICVAPFEETFGWSTHLPFTCSEALQCL